MRKLALWIVAWPPRLVADRRGAVALILALVLPVLVGATALALEVSSWSVTKIALQRRADMAAYAAIMRYEIGDTPQVATGIGVDVAAMNGATAATPTWTGPSGTPPSTMTASDVTVALVSGVRNGNNPAMKAVVTTSVPLSLGGLVTSLSFNSVLAARTAVTISATAYAEYYNTGAGTGGYPCATALKNSASGGTGVTVMGGAAVNLASCNVRSNAGVSVTNGSSITTPWVYGTSVTISGNSFITNGTTTVRSSPTPPDTTAPINITNIPLPDPYAGSATTAGAAITSDFASLSPGSGTAFTGTYQASTLSPGTYSSMTSGSGPITLNPGLYIVNGNINISNGATLTGSGVTIITSGTVSFGGGSTVTLSAPLATSTAPGIIPGILIAGNSASTDTISNGMKPTLTGVVYYPNGTMAISGGVNVGNGCLEILAGSLSISNGATFGSSCSTYLSAPPAPSLPGYVYGLVQ
jgi:Flp pilus assembly protein TadG